MPKSNNNQNENEDFENSDEAIEETLENQNVLENQNYFNMEMEDYFVKHKLK